MKQCEGISYLGSQCTMADGHFGPHVVGSPYNPIERWPQENCRGHEFHLNSYGERGLARVEWDECIHCGERR